jgi:hypothetical protein
LQGYVPNQIIYIDHALLPIDQADMTWEAAGAE